jgi:hypothetical protein
MEHDCIGHVYHLRHCLTCCARLVIDARPSRKHQEGMLSHVSRWHGREYVLDEVRRLDDRANTSTAELS